MDITIERVSATSPEAGRMIGMLDDDLRTRYPGAPIYGIDAGGFERDGGYFAVIRLNGQLVGCGAFRPLDTAVAEIKRVFVVPEYRGRALARRMIAFLEENARAAGYTCLRLETGEGQPEAIGLYRSSGYYPIPVFGPYVANPASRCFEKLLTPISTSGPSPASA